MNRLRAMEVFVATCEAGSFAAAANRLEMSPQMVARYIADLEAHLQVRLLNRTTRRQNLTEIGRAYFDRCIAVLAEAKAADAIVLETRGQPAGALKVSAPQNFGGQSLMPFVTDFLTDHPLVSIDLDLTDRFVDLIAEGIEVAFRIGEPKVDTSSSLVMRSLNPYRLIACAAPAYLRANGTPQTPADLAEHVCLGYVFWERVMDKQWIFTRDGVAYPVSVGSRLRVNDAGAQLNAALCGFGILLAAEDLIAPSLASGALVPVLPGFDGPSKPMSLLYPADRLRTLKVRRFIDAAVERFA
ncbi:MULTISPECIES: LysR family transcriptional regulator [unclassified Pseudomonas]|uniref:LysR family transcriptional regulator n=1 Tax=unclassified Pseudomonas TaxID=196821 RepID=UPI00382DAECF